MKNLMVCLGVVVSLSLVSCGKKEEPGQGRRSSEEEGKTAKKEQGTKAQPERTGGGGGVLGGGLFGRRSGTGAGTETGTETGAPARTVTGRRAGTDAGTEASTPARTGAASIVGTWLTRTDEFEVQAVFSANGRYTVTIAGTEDRQTLTGSYRLAGSVLSVQPDDPEEEAEQLNFQWAGPNQIQITDAEGNGLIMERQ